MPKKICNFIVHFKEERREESNHVSAEFSITSITDILCRNNACSTWVKKVDKKAKTVLPKLSTSKIK